MTIRLRSRATMTLSARLGLIAAALIVLACAGSLGLTVLDLRTDMLRRAGTALDRNMRLLRTTLADEGGSAAFRVEDGRLLVGSHAVDGTEPAVERVKEILGGTATVFLGDTRVATNVVDAQGRRAMGTKLAVGPVREAVLARREAYRGEAEILGSTYLTAYEPILDARGEVLGILYVGVRKSDYLASLDETMLRAAGVGGLLCLLGTAALTFALRRAMAPLRGLEAAMRRMADGETGGEVPGVARRDEVGAMARAVEVFRGAMVRAQTLEAEAARARVDAEGQRRSALLGLAGGFEAAVGGIVVGVTEAAARLRVTSEGMAGTATETATQATAVACKGRTNSRPPWRSKIRPLATCSLNEEGARSGPFFVRRRS